MAVIEWKDEFKTGISGVDYEHEELINQINSIFKVENKTLEKDRIRDLMGELYGSIAGHFVLEENMMEKYKYDQLAAHKGDHEKLLDEINDLTDGFVEAGDISEEDLDERLTGWFVNHFKTHDARLHHLEELMIEHKENGSSLSQKIIGLIKDVAGKK
ncbi:MAG: hemerythrin family protein [Gammaproteobacteria bacterium]|nr:hemerythrin family protein [Gammaproteobacteria bacterium]